MSRSSQNLRMTFLTLLVWLATCQFTIAQELKVNQIYFSRGPHVISYAVFYKEGTVLLIRSKKPPSQLSRVKSAEIPYAFCDGVLSFDTRNWTPRAVPVRGIINSDGTLTIFYRHSQKEFTTTYRPYEKSISFPRDPDGEAP